MKNVIQVVSPLVFIAYLLLTRYVPMHDFAEGVLAGLSATMSVYAIVLFAKRKGKNTAINE
ncbi:hypothetical protein [Paenibacillus soyae]|uniref:Uncharacterized protein n=1 Tax=Paenibacillus soyae TaxID=2969249 RepID=A0A9X2SCK3_9BACL|nr:hypothetical protein [Paenibacillus soyae]MCR2808070.1 hypothetical protein [Paenibacillus soyae]